MNSKEIEWLIRRTLVTPIEKAIQYTTGDMIKEILTEKCNLLEELKAKFQSKNVVIVGNSPIIKSSSHGDEIDSADIVVRCNKGFLPDFLDKNDTGTKTDYISTGALDTILSRKVRIALDDLSKNVGLIVPFPYERYLYKKSGYNIMLLEKMSPFNKFDKTYMDLESLNTLALEGCNSHTPSTGITMVDLALSSNPKSLDLFGFSFDDNNRINKGRSYTKEHDFQAESIYIKGKEKEGHLNIHY